METCANCCCVLPHLHNSRHDKEHSDDEKYEKEEKHSKYEKEEKHKHSK